MYFNFATSNGKAELLFSIIFQICNRFPTEFLMKTRNSDEIHWNLSVAIFVLNHSSNFSVELSVANSIAIHQSVGSSVAILRCNFFRRKYWSQIVIKKKYDGHFSVKMSGATSSDGVSYCHKFHEIFLRQTVHSVTMSVRNCDRSVTIWLSTNEISTNLFCHNFRRKFYKIPSEIRSQIGQFSVLLDSYLDEQLKQMC